MNAKLFLFSCLGVFVFVFIYEWVFHGVFLEGLYQQTSHLWRTEEEMFLKFHWMVIGQLVLSVMFCFIFTKGYENRGIGEGVRYGLWMAIFLSSPSLIMYAVAPYPFALIAAWIVGGVVEFMIAGVILASIYRPA